MVEPRILHTAKAVLPEDEAQAFLIGRAWVPGAPGGPSPVLVRGRKLHDLSRLAPTVAQLLNDPSKRNLARSGDFPVLGTLDAALAGAPGDEGRLHLLTPIDLHTVKACGVTFARSLLERVIEEATRGDAAAADKLRGTLTQQIGVDLSTIVPGSDAAIKLKAELQKQGRWSQYMEVGLGPDVEVFTKAQTLSAIGYGDEVGLHPMSSWNNPEPEVVMIVDGAGGIVGAALGNDVNLRDVEGRSALLLGRAKDNNASCAIGPFIRLFDEHFSLDDIRRAQLTLDVEGLDGFHLKGASSMKEISRDPADLVRQTHNRNHQYPDGLALFTGTAFAPIEDRGAPRMGFTHKVGDVVRITSTRLGRLENIVTTSDRARPWTFGMTQLMDNLARRGLLGREGNH